MSTKWNNALKLQKTPKVCKDVPPPPPEDETTFHEYPLQAYASWRDGHTPLEQQVSGMTTLEPDPPNYTHSGWIEGERASLELVLLYNPISLEFLYTITLWIGGLEDDMVSVTFKNPTASLPFAAGLFVWNSPDQTKYVESKIYS